MNNFTPSRRRLLSFAGAAAFSNALPGCTSAPALVAFAGLPPGGRPEIIVATTRKPFKAALKQPWFGTERNEALTAARVKFHAPDLSLTGRVASTVTGEWKIDKVLVFGEGGAAKAIAQDASDRDALVFVHGFNETFETAAVSLAQLREGIGFRGAPVLFSWPSRGALLSYGYDRESALWARDPLDELIAALTAGDQPGRVHIVAHSMGTFLTVEALRQQALRQNGLNADRIGAVVLASPDIDIDLFQRSLGRAGDLAKRMTVITSAYDRALAVSRRIAGNPRVGAAEREKLEAMGVTVADASDFGSGILHHDLFLANEDVRSVVKRAIERAA